VLSFMSFKGICYPAIRGSRVRLRRIGSASNIKADSKYGSVHLGNGMLQAAHERKLYCY
jgi:hypothetical protein